MVERERDCTSHEELASAARDGELTAAERDELDTHLVDCEACRELRDGFDLVDAAFAADVPATPHRLHVAVDASLNTAPAPPAIPPRRTLVASLAAAALLFVIAIGLWSESSSPGIDPGARTAGSDGDRSTATIEALQQRALADQAFLMETMQWELRALRLEVRALRDGESAATAPALLDRIDALLAHAETAPWHPERTEPTGENR